MISLNQLPSTALLVTSLVGPLMACGEDASEPIIAPAESVSVGQDWYAERALALGISEVEAISRDQLLAEAVPEATFWDGHLQAASAALWAKECARCHGVKGQLEGAETHDPAPTQWGTFDKEALFFLMGDKLRLMMFHKIRDGGCIVNGKVSAMPAFGDRLTHEQIWGLVWYLEGL